MNKEYLIQNIKHWDWESYGKENKDSAWYYPSPKEAAKEIKDYVAFWKGVEIVE